MAPISLKKRKIDRLAGELIKHILDVEDGDANIKVALDYVMSNFRFHRFLDVNPLDVSRSLTGLTSKFRVNSQDKKAIYLENLVEKFVNQPLLEKSKEIQTDAHYSLLCCLMKLSNNPLNTAEFIPKEEQKKLQKETDHFDWTTYLLAGESELQIGVEMEDTIENELYNSDEDLWTLSESENSSDEEDEDPIYAEIGELKIKQKDDTHFIDREKDIEWLENNIIQPYWNEKSYFVLDRSKYQFGNDEMCNNWELYKSVLQERSNIVYNYEVLTELQLVRETLWMLQGVENLHVFKYHRQEYTPNKKVVVHHLTKDTLQELLTKFTEVGTKVVELKLFSAATAHSDDEPKTLRAFGYVISQFLSDWRNTLSGLEQQVIDKDKPITLAALYETLVKDFARVRCIHQIYLETRVKGFDEYSLTTERVVHFLDVFYNALCTLDSLGDAGINEMSLILPMFLHICEPYLYDLDDWMTMGTLPHSSNEEFMIYRTEEKSHGNINFWSHTFRIKESKGKTLVPKFIQGVQKQILIGGKSLGLLSEFGKFSQSVVSAKTVFEQYQENLQNITKQSNERFLKGEDLPIGEYQVDGRGRSLFHEQSVDPLVRENFENMFLKAYQIMKRNEAAKNNSHYSNTVDWKKLLEHGSCRPPMKLLMEKSLHPVILERYNKASALLLELFKQEMNLFYHLDVMRDFFLMQAAGTMYEFYSEVFEKIKRGDFHEMSFLNIVLQDALQVQYPQLMGNLTLCESDASIQTYSSKLDNLSLNYKVPWPINIILTDEIQAQYNEVFRFLLKVKRAIWTLENLRFHELVSGLTYLKKSENGIDEEEEEPLRMIKRNDVILTEKPLQLLKMRMLTMRMKMLHVIRNFHFYLMTRIESTMQTEVEKKLKLATDLDEILTLHRSLLNSLIHKCFLHEKIARSREAIMRILNMVFDFEILWVDGVTNIDVGKLNRVEKEFNRCTSFLHSFFSSLAKRGSYPHVEFLAHSLKTESQGHRALFRR